jgi:hypothetical protein
LLRKGYAQQGDTKTRISIGTIVDAYAWGLLGKNMHEDYCGCACITDDSGNSLEQATVTDSRSGRQSGTADSQEWSTVRNS